MLGPVVKAAARLTAWLVQGRNTQLRAEERSTIWVVGGPQAMIDICEKRTSEDLFYTIDCTPLLDPNETILQVIGNITADQGNLTFGTPSINVAQIVTKDRRIIAARKAIQVEISGGALAGRSVLHCYVRPVISTTLDGVTVYNPKREPTVLLRLINNPPV
ncbi:hypothetical protein ACQ858_08415 [Variovorax ureilyticus]|uniref:hypothetical protein n=1 Tax=Variovorax ureilyticus TaxID=1836198 RepID=UPI003D67B481